MTAMLHEGIISIHDCFENLSVMEMDTRPNNKVNNTLWLSCCPKRFQGISETKAVKSKVITYLYILCV